MRFALCRHVYRLLCGCQAEGGKGEDVRAERSEEGKKGEAEKAEEGEGKGEEGKQNKMREDEEGDGGEELEEGGELEVERRTKNATTETN